MSRIVNHVRGKMDKPTNEGTQDQILRSDGHGGSVWGNAASPTDVANAVTNWLNDNIPTGQTVAVDQSLTVSGAAADAKVVGDDVADLKSAYNYTAESAMPLVNEITNQITDKTIIESLNPVSVTSGKALRYVNGEYTIINSQYWSITEFSVQELSIYSVSGSRGQYIPIAVFADANGNYLGFTTLEKIYTHNYLRETIIIETPLNCSKVYVNCFNGASPSVSKITLKIKADPYLGAINISNLLGWEEGGITNGYNSDSTTRIRTERIYKFSYPIFIPANPDVSIGLWTYTGYSFGDNAQWAGWVSDGGKTSYVIPANTYFRLLTMDGGMAKRDYIKLYNYDLTTYNGYNYQLPINWRHAILNNSGALYFSMYGLTSDLLIPTAICDYAVKKIASSAIGMSYYDIVNGMPKFIKRVDIPSANTRYVIEKTYPFFAVSIFLNWTTELAFSDADDYVLLHYLPTNERQIKNSLLFSVLKTSNNHNDKYIWSICHQGYSDDGLGNNLPGGYTRAASRGFTHGECDIKLTSDNKLVCSHDPSFVDSVTGNTIVIAEHTLSELQTYSYYGGTIATLSDIISECKQAGIGLFIDQVNDTNVSYAVDVVKQHNAMSICYFMSGSTQTLSSIITMDKDANIVYLTYLASSVTDVLPSLIALNHDLIYDAGQYNSTQITNVQTIANALPGNMRLMIWTVDNTEHINETLPYICGWTSNAISGRDIFNPAQNMGLNI